MTKERRDKEELLKRLEQLEKNPGDRLTILADIGAIGVGAVGAGAAAVAFGGTTATVLFGLVAIPVAAPVAVVAGATVLGGAAILGVKRVLFDGTFHQGKREALRKQLEEEIQEIERRERQNSVNTDDKTHFYAFLKEPLKLDLISAEDAKKLIELVESGAMCISDAYKLIGELLADVRGLPPAKT